MEEFKSITRFETEKKLDEENLKINRIICFALAGSPLTLHNGNIIFISKQNTCRFGVHILLGG
ncbi:MAG: hypothetical protein KKG93_11105 [Bacteroidetes bacterium]|nr:hypothetical protein [Bacteroidota bacterium]